MNRETLMLSVACPTCDARRGHGCTNTPKPFRAAFRGHAARREKALALAWAGRSGVAAQPTVAKPRRPAGGAA